MIGGSRSKYCEVWFLYRQHLALCNIAHTKYILPTALNPTFRVFFKVKEFKIVNDIFKYPFHIYSHLTHMLIPQHMLLCKLCTSESSL